MSYCANIVLDTDGQFGYSSQLIDALDEWETDYEFDGLVKFTDTYDEAVYALLEVLEILQRPSSIFRADRGAREINFFSNVSDALDELADIRSFVVPHYERTINNGYWYARFSIDEM